MFVYDPDGYRWKRTGSGSRRCWVLRILLSTEGVPRLVGKLITQHCNESKSKTYNGDQ